MDLIKLSKMTRFLSDYPNISPTLKTKLEENGFRYANQLRYFENIHILENEKYGFTADEIKEIEMKILNNKNDSMIFKPLTIDMLNSKTEYIRFGCDDFDKVFSNGNGLPTGRLLQLFGEAGAGKSQICFQLCFRVRLDKNQGGLNGEALYLDTENSFRPERIKEIATNYYENEPQSFVEKQINEIMAGIHCRYVNTHADDLYSLIVDGDLESFLDEHRNIRLLILDSIAYHFRYDYQYDHHHRIIQLMDIANKFKQLACERNLAIVIVNQVSFMADNQALGDVFKTTSPTILNVKRIDNDEQQQQQCQRKCTVMKSPSIPKNYNFKYIINKFGIQESV